MNKRALGIVAAAAFAIAALAAPAAAKVTRDVVFGPSVGEVHVIKSLPNGMIQQWWLIEGTGPAAHDTVKPADRWGPFDAADCDETGQWTPEPFWVPYFPAASYYYCRTFIDPQAVLAKLPKS